MTGAGPQLAGRYVVDRLLARGGMADVHLGRDTVLDRPVAVKVLRTGAADRRRFEAEVRLLGQLNHDNLVHLFDAGEHDGVPFIVLEYVDGPTLGHRLKQGPLPPDAAARVATDVGAALAYVHSQGVVHRDVKPSNLLLAPDGRVVLGDFGIARLLDSSRLTARSSMIGTAAYLAPEQVEGAEVTPAADVYSLGLVLLEALTGTMAFAGPPHEAAIARLGRDPHVPASLPPPWPRLLSAMTARDPAARPAAADVGPLVADPDATIAIAAAPPAPTADGPITQVLPRPVTAAAGSGRPAARLRWPAPLPARSPLAIAIGVTVLVVAGLLFLGLRGGAGDGGGGGRAGEERPPASIEPAATPTPTDAPPPVDQLSCGELEAAKNALDAEKNELDRGKGGGRGGGDKGGDDEGDDENEALLERIDERKEQLEEQKENAGC